MDNHAVLAVRFQPGDHRTAVASGASIVDAARAAGVDIHVPCGGQGRCGRCAVVVRGADGAEPVKRRSTLRLSAEDLAAGYALACQTLITGDVEITIPPQERIARILTSDKAARGIELPFVYSPGRQPVISVFLRLDPPSLADQVDDWSRVQAGLRRRLDHHGDFTIDLPVLRRLGDALRQADWQVTAVVELDTWDRPQGPPRVVDVWPGDRTSELWAAALDIGTTTVTLVLVDLLTGRVVAQAADYNAQIRRGEDVISRIIYATRTTATAGGGEEGRRGAGARQGRGLAEWTNGVDELQRLAVETINGLVEQVSAARGIEPWQIVKMVVSGNPTMLHLFLGLPPGSIRLAPYTPAVNDYPTVRAGELGLAINPQATVDCLPGVASYVGADISAGVVGSSLEDVVERLGDGRPVLFLDIGTNGEMVLGDGSWLVTCACSAGPAFEGAGVYHGMRATLGAVEEVWIDPATFEPTISVIGQEQGERPRGLCGSGLISLLAEMFVCGVIDRGGNLNLGWYDNKDWTNLRDLSSLRPRVRQGEHGAEYVVAWAEESANGEDIVITKVDIDNLMRAKAAIYAGCAVLAQSVGLSLDDVGQVLVGGSFGKHINVEKSIQIGLLPDRPWEAYQFLGNTSVRGAALALLDRNQRLRVAQTARRMTYLELSADNSFYEQFTSAMFLPHTDTAQFPSVRKVIGNW